MEDEGKTPKLMELLFGEAAKIAQRGASERMARWRQAYEEWLAERKQIYQPDTAKQSVLAWRRLASQCGKPPWELTTRDFEQHAAWMQAEGYSPATIGCALGIFANFYRWCGERRVDPECQTGFNPAEKARRPQVGRYRGAKLLCREEAERLLRTMQRDPSELGKRDYAFTLARLRLGAPLRSLQQLKWGQIGHDREGSWVRWRPEAERQHLPAEVWEAMQHALEASGRLGEMRAGDYIFAPLAEPGKAETGSRAEDWRGSRHLTTGQLLLNLKLYGRLAGIEEERLTLMALRRTAIRLRLDEGASLGDMQAFMDCREETKSTKYRLGKLPRLPAEGGRSSEGGKNDELVPVRKAKPFKPGEGMTHGFYMRNQPPRSVAAVLKEGVQGIEEEIVDLRMLGRELLERQGEARNSQEAAQLGEAYTLAAYRIGEMIKVEKALTEGGKASQWAEEVLAMLDRVMIQFSGKPVSDQVRKDALLGEPNLEAAARRLVEEVAAIRCVLRRVFRLASEAQETRDYVRLVEIYGSACVRLVRLLKIERGNAGQLEAFLKEMLDKTINDVVVELGITLNDRNGDSRGKLTLATSAPARARLDPK